MSTVNKYWEKYKEKKNSEHNEKSELSKIMTDKSAYITYLEVQLDKVTQSVLLTQTFSERLDNIQFQFQSSEEKISQLTKLIKLQQTYAEKQEEDLSSFKTSVDSLLDSKLSQVLCTMQSLERRVKVLEEKPDSTAYKTIQPDQMKSFESMIQTSESKTASTLEKHSEDLESKLRRLIKASESNLELKFSPLSDQCCELMIKMQKFQDFQNNEDRIQKSSGKNEQDFNEKLRKLENNLKDLEQFLLAVAEDVKKLDDNQQVLTESETRLSKNFNMRLQKLSDLIHKVMDLNESPLKQSPDKFVCDKNWELRDSPKFPTMESDKVKNQEIKKVKKTIKSKSKDSSDNDKLPSNSSLKSNTSLKSNRSNTSKPSTPTRSISPIAKKENLHPAQKSTPKSKQIEASIKSKVKKLKSSSTSDPPKPAGQKSQKKHSKLDELYQELFLKN